MAKLSKFVPKKEPRIAPVTHTVAVRLKPEAFKMFCELKVEHGLRTTDIIHALIAQEHDRLFE